MRDRDPSIAAVRAAADQVARELPALSPRRARGGQRAIWIAAAVLLVGLAITPVALKRLAVSTDVEVELLQVQGRDVPARVIDDSAAGAILVRPASTSPGAAMALHGELP